MMQRMTDILALAFWLFLAGLRLGQAWVQRNPLALLLAVQAGLVACALAVRRSDVAQVPRLQKLVAWGSALLPFALQVEQQPGAFQVGMAVAGLALAVWGLGSLGRAFGVAPADRGLVLHGPYRLLRHPIYAGELLAVLAVLLGTETPWNALVVGLLLGAVLLRIRWEERALCGYSGYAQRTRWRLLPGVW